MYLFGTVFTLIVTQRVLQLSKRLSTYSIRASRFGLRMRSSLYQVILWSNNMIVLPAEPLCDGRQCYCECEAICIRIYLLKPFTISAGSTINFTFYGSAQCTGSSIGSEAATNGNCGSAGGQYRSKTTAATASSFSSTSTSPSLKACFAGTETVTLESGGVKPISEVRAGDRVLAADASRRTLFSEVVFVPHGSNADKTVFTHITTTQGRDIKMTHTHILPAGACNSPSLMPDVYAS